MSKTGREHTTTSNASPSIPLLRRPRPPSQSYQLNKKQAHPSSSSQAPAWSQGSNRCYYPYPPPSTAAYPVVYDDPHFPDIHPLHPRGPPFMPPGRIMRSGYCYYEGVPVHDYKPPEFTLNDFLKVSNDPSIMVSGPGNPVISRENYLKMTSWFATHIPKQAHLNTVNIKVEDMGLQDRKPQQQILIELRAMLRAALLNSSSLISTSSDSQSNIGLTDDHYQRQPSTRNVELLHFARSRFFCGEGRGSSPFDSAQQPVISPAEVAILYSMMEGGQQLSFKAHFLQTLPNLSPLAHTLLILNLSFNELSIFPEQVLNLPLLICLRMRNNPIRNIPSAIKQLNNLQLLSVPFNLLSSLPQGLFELVNLKELDVSHNSLQWISRDIIKLKNLQVLNVEHNQLTGLPATTIHLTQLNHLLVDGNYFHPLLWEENSSNQPQALRDLCCVAVSRCVARDKLTSLPPEAQTHLFSGQEECDCCHGVVYGPGLRLIRAVRELIFGMKHLPFIFTVCSPVCWHRLEHNDGTDHETAGEHS